MNNIKAKIHKCIGIIRHSQQAPDSPIRKVEILLQEVQGEIGTPTNYIETKRDDENWSDYHKRIKS